MIEAMALAMALSMHHPVPTTHITNGQHTCSYTNPEYMASTWDMDVHTRPGTTSFTAEHTPLRGFEDAYWVTGFHNENSSICDRRQVRPGVYGHSWALPIKVSKLPLITADFTASGEGRIGFDIWLTADRRETGPSKMEHDSRTWEILIQPVHRWTNFGNPGWHRIYLSMLPNHGGVISARALDITRVIRNLGVPGGEWLMAIDAGGETPSGSITVENYALHIGGQHPKPVHHPRHHKHHPKTHHPHKRHHRPVHHPKQRKHGKPPVPKYARCNGRFRRIRLDSSQPVCLYWDYKAGGA